MLAAAAPTAAPAAGQTAALEESVSYRLPFEAGVPILVSQGWHGSYSHTGTASFAYDFVLSEGTPVLASAGGRVAYAHSGEAGCGGPDLVAQANFVTLYHADGTATHYGHLAGVAVVAGQEVAAGQVIGRLGSTGFTNCDAHLHFARQVQGGPVTQSIPLYFAEYPGLELLAGQIVAGAQIALAAALAVEVEHIVEVELRADVAMRQEVRSRLESLRSLDGWPHAWPTRLEPESPLHPTGRLEAP